MSIRTYTSKRDFSKTSEPKGEGTRSGRGGSKRGKARFVIQKHDASRLHYDFRIEMGGALKSWAVPKGMPWTRGEKHLAVSVEDHPLEYGGFEGVIPKGQYGGGTVMLWDRGTYEVLGGSATEDLAKGKLRFALHGEKLEGGWTLVRSDDDQWLLIKSGESMRAVSKRRDDESVLTGRTMAEIARQSTTEKAKLTFIAPMLATLVSELPRHGEWHYELKFDGYRTLALKEGATVRLLSRNNKKLDFPEIAEAIADLPVGSAALDGEIVALDSEGRPSFQHLQAREMGTEQPPMFLYLFDLLAKEGEDLRDMPLERRRALLEELLHDASGFLRISGEIRGDPRKLLEEVRSRGLEGIVGKEAGSVYESGRRSRRWIKLKCVQEQEFVIGGYTLPAGTRQHFGALLVGYYQNGSLQYAGKVGTGFTEQMLASLGRKLRSLKRDESPFQAMPQEMRKAHWVEPELVCQIRFSEWTRDGKLRQGAFLGLRKDKKAGDVVRETTVRL